MFDVIGNPQSRLARPRHLLSGLLESDAAFANGVCAKSEQINRRNGKRVACVEADRRELADIKKKITTKMFVIAVIRLPVISGASQSMPCRLRPTASVGFLSLICSIRRRSEIG